MVLVKAFEPFTGIEIKEETSWGVDPGTWGTSSYRVPFTSEDIHQERDIFPDSTEFGALGGLISVDSGRNIVLGSLTVEPAYDTIWFWKLFAQAWGTENLVLDNNVLAAAETGVNTHIFTPGTALPVGLAARVWKAGPGPAASGFMDLLLGLKVSRMVWNQPAGDRCTVTFDFIGKSKTPISTSGLTLIALETGPRKVKALDLQRSGSVIVLGDTLTAHNITGFTLTVDRQVEAPDGFLNNLLTLPEPGIVATRVVTLDITSNLEQDYGSANKPGNEFGNDLDSSAVIIYDSGVVAGGTSNYKIRFDLPKIRWTDFRNNIDQPIPEMTATGRAQVGLYTRLDAPYGDDFATIPTSAEIDVRALVNVNQSDEPTSDTKFSALPNAA